MRLSLTGMRGTTPPLLAAAEKYAGVHKEDSSVSLGMSELRKEAGIFEAHCEEYRLRILHTERLMEWRYQY